MADSLKWDFSFSIMILKGTSHSHPKFWLLSGSFFYNKWSISTFEEKCQVEFFEGKGVCNYVKELASKSAVLVMSQSLAGSQSFRSRILVGCLDYQLLMWVRIQLAGKIFLPVTDVEDNWVNNLNQARNSPFLTTFSSLRIHPLLCQSRVLMFPKFLKGSLFIEPVQWIRCWH